MISSNASVICRSPLISGGGGRTGKCPSSFTSSATISRDAVSTAPTPTPTTLGLYEVAERRDGSGHDNPHSPGVHVERRTLAPVRDDSVAHSAPGYRGARKGLGWPALLRGETRVRPAQRRGSSRSAGDESHSAVGVQHNCLSSST